MIIFIMGVFLDGYFGVDNFLIFVDDEFDFNVVDMLFLIKELLIIFEFSVIVFSLYILG